MPQRLLSVPIKPKPEFDVADHERRRALFKQMCAYPTPSQRVTFQIWAQGMKKTLGSDFCNDLEYKYFGTVREPRTGDSAGFIGAGEIRDLSPIQYFGGIKSYALGETVSDLSPLYNYTSLESLYIDDNKNILDLSVIANFKNLKTLNTHNIQVASLAPLAALVNLQTLKLTVLPQTGLPGHKGFDALRHLKSLTDLSITVAEPLGDQLKDLRQLQSLVIYGPVKDVCSFKNLTNLTLLYLISSGVSDIACLKNLKNLVVIDIGDNPIKSIAELAPLPNLRNLSINNTLVEDLSALTNHPIMFVVRAEGTPLRWCSPKTAVDIKKGVSCLNPDGTEKPWWKRLLRM